MMPVLFTFGLFVLAVAVSVVGGKLAARAIDGIAIAPKWSPESARIAVTDSEPVEFSVVVPLVGLASYYGEWYRGKVMANGEPYNPDAFTCASWDYKLGALLVVKDCRTGRTVLVRVTDRGPAVRYRLAGRVVDLSERAFSHLTNRDAGLIEVAVYELPEIQP